MFVIHASIAVDLHSCTSNTLTPGPPLYPPLSLPGNDFSTLYAPLIRDGRMEKYYWNPTRADRIGVCSGIFVDDNLKKFELEELVDSFPGQSIDFFGALRARVYDDKVRMLRRRGMCWGRCSCCVLVCVLQDGGLGVVGAWCAGLCMHAGSVAPLAVSARGIVRATPELPVSHLHAKPASFTHHSSNCCAALSPQVREFVDSIGYEKIGSRLVNSKQGKVEFEKPSMDLQTLIKYGKMLVDEQDNVKRVQLAEAYMSGAELAGASGTSMPEAFKLQ